MSDQNDYSIIIEYKDYEINIKIENNDWFSYFDLPNNVQHHLFSFRWYKEVDIIIFLHIINDFIKFFKGKPDINSKAPFYLGVNADHSAAHRLLSFKKIRKNILSLGYEKEAKNIHLECERIFNSINSEVTYRFFSNHALMSDLALLDYMSDFDRDINEVFKIFNRIIKNLEVIFDFNTGACREHSISYQEYNLDLLFVIRKNLKDYIEKYAGLNFINNELDILYNKVKNFSRFILYSAYIDKKGYIPLGDTFEDFKLKVMNRVFNVKTPEYLLDESYENLIFFSKSFGSYIYKTKNISFTLHNSLHSTVHKQDDDLSITLTVLGKPIFLDGGYHDIHTSLLELKSNKCHSLPILPNRTLNPPSKVKRKSELEISNNGFSVTGTHYRYPSISVERKIGIDTDKITILDSASDISMVIVAQYILSPYVEILKITANLILLKIDNIVLSLAYTCKLDIENINIIYNKKITEVKKIIFSNNSCIETIIILPKPSVIEEISDFRLVTDDSLLKEDRGLLDIDNVNIAERRVSLFGNSIKINTEKVHGSQYAFYLNHRGGVEKTSYSYEAKAIFNMSILPGDYFARFFYKVGKNVKTIKMYFNIDNLKNVVSAEVIEIANEDKYSVEYYPNESEITFIVFNEDGAKKSAVPFGIFFLLKLGFNVIAIKQDNDKYQSLSFSNFKDIVSPLVQDKKVFLYGSSLGGYCAIYYAGAVNGVAISAAPRNSFHPVLEQKTKSIGEYKHSNITSNQLSEKYILVILDPNHENDKFFFEKVILPAYPNVHLIELPDVGHKVLLHTNYTNQLKKIILDVVNGDYNSIYINENISSPYQYRVLSLKYFEEKDYRKAIYFAGCTLKEDTSTDLDVQMIYIIKRSLEKINI